MSHNPMEAILGFIVLIFAGAFLVFASSHVNVKKVEGYTLQATFLKIGGLEMGADVRINGIKVGSVTKIELDKDYLAGIEMTIKDNILLPVDTTATIADSGIMGDKYVRLEPGKSLDKLRKNGRIEKTRPYKSLEDNVREFIFLSTQDDAQK